MMTTELKTNPFESEAFVYIRHLDADELQSLLPPNAVGQINDPDELFVVLSADGVRLAVVEGRDAAVAAALANDLKPLSVH
ncbi:DUF1150 family protein [Hyphomonas johnsonii]|jgi:hypothetical protein|uniref:DUF1150 domain-containing protein n=1 Tax=Hyphomonas johnsonii MHS-2 TaxID=1280950 RepID=A0A059FHW7_9PROT|nr:DUF1150 family protein [Hyphomonas johnsonii]KCZ90058.1 hypothetical protein HJO_13951 [Hyphomonas johnsonii MHS-2]